MLWLKIKPPLVAVSLHMKAILVKDAMHCNGEDQFGMKLRQRVRRMRMRYFGALGSERLSE